MAARSRLPNVVIPRPGTVYPDASKIEDVRRVGYMLLNMHSKTMLPVLAAIADVGMMAPAGWQGLFVRAFIRLICWRHGWQPYDAWLAVFKEQPELAEEFRKQTLRWMLEGKDADGEGVGGFNQNELIALQNFIVTANEAEAKADQANAERGGRLILPAPTGLDRRPD